MAREGSPDEFGVGFISESHPLRLSADEETRVQQMKLLEVPGGRSGSRHSRQSSLSSSVTDLSAPIYSRERVVPQQKNTEDENKKNEQVDGNKLTEHGSNYTDSSTVANSNSNDATHLNAANKLTKNDEGNSLMGFNGRLAFAIAAAALGSSFQHGYNTGVVNAPQKLIEEWISQVASERAGEQVDQSHVTMIWAIAVAIFCVGGMLGGCITGFVADKFGRKGGLLLNNIFVFAAALFEGTAKSANSYEMLILGRFLIGINSGLNAGLAPMYLAEISPIHLRGAVGTVYQLVITISILISQIFGLESVLGTATKWPILLAITAVPAIFQLATLPICPESPKFILLGRGKELEAQRALTWLRGSIEVHEEMEEMRSEYEASKLVPKITMREMFVNSALRSPLMIALVIMVAQQLSGINAVMFFSTKIFKMAQLSEEHAQYATLSMGSMNVVMTLVSLVLVEKAGRKTLLLVGFTGMFFDTVLLAICLLYVEKALWVSYLSILLVIIFVVMFATGPGSIPWFLVSELFNQSARPAATSLAVCVNWTANFIVGIGFLPLQEVLGGNVFFVFAVLLAIFVLFVYKKVPETKNKTMEEISTMFRQQSYQ